MAIPFILNGDFSCDIITPVLDCIFMVLPDTLLQIHIITCKLKVKKGYCKFIQKLAQLKDIEKERL